MLKFSIISVDTPNIEPSNNIYLIGGNAATLTCNTDYDDMGYYFIPMETS